MNSLRFRRIVRDVLDLPYHFRRVKWAYQRATRGWSDSDCWDLGNTFSKRIAQALRRYQKNLSGHPVGLGAPCTCEIPGEPEDNCMAVWASYVEAMAVGFEALEHVAGDCGCPEVLDGTGLEKHRRFWEEQQRIGFEVAGEWFGAVWD
jgi:hypothetical protein